MKINEKLTNVDYSNKHICTNANEATKTGGYYTNSTTTNLPWVAPSASSGYLYVMSHFGGDLNSVTQIWTRYKDGEMYIRHWYSFDTSEVTDGWSEWVQLLTNEYIVDYTVTSDTNSVSFDDLNMTAKHIYKICIEGTSTAQADLYLTFNDLNTGYFQIGKCFTGNGTTNDVTGFSYTNSYRPNKTGFYLGHALLPNPTSIEGTFKFVKDTNGDYKLQYLWQTKCIWNGSQVDGDCIGAHGTTTTSINKINLRLGTGNIKAGTRIRIWKER